MKNYQTTHKQSGSVLAISLVLLTAITLIAAMGMQRSSLQTRITANVLHKELLFNTAMNEQEFWFNFLRTASTGDPQLSDPIRSFRVDPDTGGKIYEPVDLDTMIPTNFSANTDVVNQLILVGSTPGVNSLAQGQEIGNRVLYRYQLSSTANLANRIGGRAQPENQVTGVSFPGLNTGKNSLYSTP